MSWFKKKDSAIPPVNEPARSNYLGTGASAGIKRSPSPGVASRSYNQPPTFMNNDPYERQQFAQGAGPQSTAPPPAGGQPGPNNSANLRERFHRNDPVGDPYARGRGNLDQDKAELFAGYDPEKHKPSGRFADNNASRNFPESMPDDANEEDEVEGIKKQTRALKQDSAASTRNALRIAREAEETARNTLTRLGDQSEKLASTERHLDVAKGFVNRVEDKQDELKQLNRSIFRPVITFNKDGKRLAQENKLLARHQEEREEHEKAMRDIRETNNRIGQAQAYAGEGSGRFKTAEALAKRKDARQRYQFEASASDDEIEDEIEDNLDEIDDMAKRLKALSTAMGQELDNQNARLDRMDNKTTNLDTKITLGTRRFEKFT